MDLESIEYWLLFSFEKIPSQENTLEFLHSL